jgi:hypothetical protein
MAGAIEAAEAIEPGVWRIVTFSGGRQDTVYLRSGGRWTAYDSAP